MSVSVSGCAERWSRRQQHAAVRRGWRAWRCTRPADHDGSCALLPRWWNLRGQAQQLRHRRATPR